MFVTKNLYSMWSRFGSDFVLHVLRELVSMAPKRPPSPKRSGPEWLRNAGTRADEFARQAVWPQGLPRPPAPSTENEAEILRSANLAKAGPGLAYEKVASTASPSELA